MIMRADKSAFKVLAYVFVFINDPLQINNNCLRSGDEMDQVTHGRWGREEGSDVSEAPITDDSGSGSASDSRSDESRTPSRSPTPRRDIEERSQSRGSFDDGIEVGITGDEKATNIPKEDPRDKLPYYLPSVYGCRSVEEFQVYIYIYM